jgi:hypothetical protein
VILQLNCEYDSRSRENVTRVLGDGAPASEEMCSMNAQIYIMNSNTSEIVSDIECYHSKADQDQLAKFLRNLTNLYGESTEGETWENLTSLKRYNSIKWTNEYSHYLEQFVEAFKLNKKCH